MASIPRTRSDEVSTQSETRFSGRSRLRSLLGVQILSSGSHVPECTVSNEDLAELGYDANWILQRTGIRARRKAEPEVASSDMAIEAARECINNANVDPNEIDLVVVATMTPDTPIPSTACLVQERLGLNAPAMDVNAACAGFMYALVTGMQFVKCGTSNLALVVGTDTNTRIVNPRDQKTFPLFGDGAGAVLLQQGDEQQGMIGYTLGAEGAGADLLGIRGGGSRCPLSADCLDSGQQYIHMDGRPVFKWAVRVLTDSIQDVLAHSGYEVADIDLFCPHQANARIIDAAAEALELDRKRIMINLDRFGNTSAASIPLCISEAQSDGRISSGDLVLLSGFGAGLAWGTALIRW